MAYDFANLSPADFEDLARDLLGREVGARFEAFAAGPDGGMDGRHAPSPTAKKSSTILQAKHYVRSTFADLKKAMQRERLAIDKLASGRYLLATSRPLTPPNKRALADVIGPALKSESDIYSADDLNGLLRKYPDIERAHIKLWLSSGAVLDRIVNAAVLNNTAMTQGDIEKKVKIYAPNPSFHEAREKLESVHVLIVSGPPGVGKTTLAEMLSYSYIGDKWNFVAIRSLDDGFSTIVDGEKQIFLFDDFLGKISLDARALASKDTDLIRFVRRVQASPNARFVLTTRAYLFEEARRISEPLGDPRIDISKYVIDVGIYTRRIKARILYNHLAAAEVPRDYLRSLVESGKLPQIIDHKNYNPRIIEWMTDALHLRDVTAAAYAPAFIAALEDPSKIWDAAFRTHIPTKCRHLLITLFFFSEHLAVNISELRNAFLPLHAHLCEKYGLARDPKDFDEALKILEGGFLKIIGKRVGFVNPSLRDYLDKYSSDFDLIRDFGSVARSARWAEGVWEHGIKQELPAGAERAFALSFLKVAEEFSRLPVWRRSPYYPESWVLSDLASTRRIRLAMDWWAASRDSRFAGIAVAVAQRPLGGFSAWGDGSEIIDILRDLRTSYGEMPMVGQLADALRAGLIEIFEDDMDADDLETFSDLVEEDSIHLGDMVVAASRAAIRREYESFEKHLPDAKSEVTLEEQFNTFNKLASRAGIEERSLKATLRLVEARQEEISAEASEAEAPPVIGPKKALDDTFSDNELHALFRPLLDE